MEARLKEKDNYRNSAKNSYDTRKLAHKLSEPKVSEETRRHQKISSHIKERSSSFSPVEDNQSLNGYTRDSTLYKKKVIWYADQDESTMNEYFSVRNNSVYQEQSDIESAEEDLDNFDFYDERLLKESIIRECT